MLWKDNVAAVSRLKIFFLLLYSGYKDWNDELPATLCTLNFNSSINAYNASHFTLAAVGYDVYVYLERFVI